LRLSPGPLGWGFFVGAAGARREGRLLQLFALNATVVPLGLVNSIRRETLLVQSHTREKIISFLQRALELAEEVEDGTAAYLIERALDEVRSETFSSIPADASAKH
jgi:hypothetical protein